MAKKVIRWLYQELPELVAKGILTKEAAAFAHASAMSMLNFYINRAGKNLNPGQKRILQQSKVELRKLFHK